VNERRLQRRQRARHLQPRTRQKRLARRQPQTHQFGRRERPLADCAQISLRMRPQQHRFRRRPRHLRPRHRPMGRRAQHLHRTPELVHRERMLLRQRKRIVGMMKTAHRRTLPVCAPRANPRFRPCSTVDSPARPALSSRFYALRQRQRFFLIQTHTMAAKSTAKKSAAKAPASAKKSASKGIKYVYTWGDGKADGNGSMKALLGGKGANLAEMTR